MKCFMHLFPRVRIIQELFYIVQPEPFGVHHAVAVEGAPNSIRIMIKLENWLTSLKTSARRMHTIQMVQGVKTNPHFQAKHYQFTHIFLKLKGLGLGKTR